ncbi:MAG TPA: ATP synthase F1 subunit delta [Planctomycetota bacterium]|nr:ATP synthase F1 subunit delta [Planctomycetota bacterium]
MSAGPVALRYATALFELAREQGVLERVEADVAKIDRELAAPGGSTWLFDARVSEADKRRRLEALAAGLQPLTANFLRLLLDKRRVGVLREIGAAFHRNMLSERNATEGVVETPRPLGPGEMAELSAALGRLLGKSVELEQRSAPALVAGVRVFVDNKLIDQSAAGRLHELRGRMLGARLGR